MSLHIKISVIIPVYRTENYLRKCLDSILASTLKEIEVICINDGSPDGCGEILASYAERDERVVIINQKNSGQGTARNKGLLHAIGEAVHFCDSDDYISNQMYAHMYELMKRNRADVVIGGTNFDYEVYDELRKSDSDYYEVKFTGLTVPSPDIILNTDVAVWNKLFRREFLLEKNILFPVTQYEDLGFFWLWTTSNPTLYYTREKLYTYVRRSNSFMTNIYSGISHFNLDDFLNIMDGVYNHLNQSSIIESYRTAYWKFYHDMLILQLYHAPKHVQEKIVFSLATRLVGMNIEYLNVDPYRKVYRDLLLISQGKIPQLNANDSINNRCKITVYLAGIRIASLRSSKLVRRLKILGIVTINTKIYEC